jgi:hypothetical protein
MICGTCKELVEPQHMCYIKPLKAKTPKNFVIIFYDLECTQNTQIGDGIFLHEPILLVAHMVCEKCYNKNDRYYTCQKCLPNKHTFTNKHNKSCVSQFITWLEAVHERINTKVHAIAHNFKSYDGQFILAELVKRKHSIVPIMCGHKILQIVYKGSLVFIDSLNFLAMPLAKFPSAFGFTEEKKGWYPHYFNTVENLNYKGLIPDKSYFALNNMSKKELEDFDEWHMNFNNGNFVYDNRKELEEYCALDVHILKRGCLKFMEDFLKFTNVNPFLESFTLSQAVMKAYRKNFLKANTIGIVPKHLYRPIKNQSVVAFKWLVYLEEYLLK